MKSTLLYLPFGLSQALQLLTGENYQGMPLGNVAAGLYLLQVRLDSGADETTHLVQRLLVE